MEILVIYGSFEPSKTKPIKANLFRIEYCVMRIAKRNLKKRNQSRPLGRKSKTRRVERNSSVWRFFAGEGNLCSRSAFCVL